MYNDFFKPRKIARKCVLQGLFCVNINKTNKKRVKDYLLKKNKKSINKSYFNKLYHNIQKIEKPLDNYIKQYSYYDYKKINLIELLVLRIALFELLYVQKIPKKVVICEALNLVKLFGSNESHKYINNVLDKIVKNLNIETTSNK